MEEMVLTEAEKKLMEIIWQVSPIESGKLVKEASDRIYWTKSTTYRYPRATRSLKRAFPVLCQSSWQLFSAVRRR